MIAPGFEPRFEPEGQTSAHRRWKWRVLLAFCAFYALSYLGRFNFSLIQTAVIADMGITRADTGWINSWMFWGFALGGLLHGRIAERIGYRVLLLYGAAGIGLFNIIASHATSVNGLLVPWALAGFFGAATWPRAWASSPSGGPVASGAGPSVWPAPRRASP